MALKLFTELFSLNPKNMRFPYFKRVLMVLLMVPFFSFLFIVNNFFLLIDHLLFFRFKKTQIKDPVFIVSMPRTGTTLLLHLLTSLNNEFTTMKLWELIFAPSVSQKLMIVFINRLDKKINSVIRRSVIYISDKIFKNLVTLHNTGLEQPEEDELVLLWSLSSPYLQYFYPESNAFDELLDFDKGMNSKRKKRIMKNYYRMVQRHNFVFNRNGNKRFLSKNPFMMSKIDSLNQQFTDAKILTINRCPNLIINSTINLSAMLFKSFSSVDLKNEIKTKIENTIKGWYFHSHEAFNRNNNLKHCYLSFDKLIKMDLSQCTMMLAFLGLDEDYMNEIANTNYKKYKSKPKSPYQLKKYVESDEIPFMKEYYREVI